MKTLKLLGIMLLILLFSAGIMLAGSEDSLTISGIPLYVLCGLCGYLLHWLMFIPAYLFQTERYFDLTGSLSFIASILVALIFNSPMSPVQYLTAALVSVWAIRLGWFLFSRVRKAGKDRRFDEIKTRFWRFLLTWTLGGTWVFITLAMALVVLTEAAERTLEGFAMVGALLWLLGFVIEVTADRQKTRFRARKENSEEFISEGLWAYSRHPNYFGEIILWLGIAVIALPSLDGWQWLTLISPLFVILLLTRVSGIPMLEEDARKRWGSRADYQHYVANTPVLVPLPRGARTRRDPR